MSTASTPPSIATCDLCDRFRDSTEAAFRVLAGPWHSYGGRAAFHGRVRTVRCLEDNALVRELVQSPGEGGVLVVDGGGSLRRALLGGNLAAFAARNGWAGVLVHGAVRDRAELRAAAVGILALGHTPMPTAKAGPGLGQGALDQPVLLGGVWVQPGEWLCADEDGVVVHPTPLTP